jgi:hypothetical protein
MRIAVNRPVATSYRLATGEDVELVQIAQRLQQLLASDTALRGDSDSVVLDCEGASESLQLIQLATREASRRPRRNQVRAEGDVRIARQKLKRHSARGARHHGPHQRLVTRANPRASPCCAPHVTLTPESAMPIRNSFPKQQERALAACTLMLLGCCFEECCLFKLDQERIQCHECLIAVTCELTNIFGCEGENPVSFFPVRIQDYTAVRSAT